MDHAFDYFSIQMVTTYQGAVVDFFSGITSPESFYPIMIMMKCDEAGLSISLSSSDAGITGDFMSVNGISHAV
jgi:hypothetical protein